MFSIASIVSVVYLVVPRMISLVRTTRLMTLSMGIFPSTLLMRMSAASSPTSTPRCSTVVSIGSQATARCPLVKPQTEISYGTRKPMRLAVYRMPMAVSSFTAKKASGFSSCDSKSGVMASASARLSQMRNIFLSGSKP